MSDPTRLLSKLQGLASQLGAALLCLVLLGLSAPARGAWLVERLDALTILFLLAWVATVVLLALAPWARDPSRPDLRLGLGLVPLTAGIGLAALGGGEGALGAEVQSHCPFVMGFGFASSRLQMLGLLASAALWLGMLPAWWRTRADEPEPAANQAPAAGLKKRLRPHMGVLAAVALWLVGAVWTLLDPLMPAKAAVGGETVLQLWWLMAALPVLFLWSRFVPAADDRARCAGLATPLGFGLLGLALALLPRVHFLSGAPPASVGAAELVFVSAWLRMVPSLLVACALALVVSWPGAGRGFMRRMLRLGVVPLVVGLLGLGQELRLRQGLEASCFAPLAEDLQLPRSDRGAVAEPAIIWILSHGAQAAAPPAALAAGRLGLAADRRLDLHALLDRVEQAAQAGWREFSLLYETPEPDEQTCARQGRLNLGLCPARRRDILRAQPFRLPHLEAQAAPGAGRTRLLVNLLADRGELELSLAAFGAERDPERLRSLEGRWAFDSAGLAALAVALREVKRQYPSSQQATLLVEGQTSLARLAELLRTVAWDPVLPGRALFPDLILDRSQR